MTLPISRSRFEFEFTAPDGLVFADLESAEADISQFFSAIDLGVGNRVTRSVRVARGCDSQPGAEAVNIPGRNVRVCQVSAISIPDCPADADNDGVVGITDFLAALANWGPCAGSCPSDQDCDGSVGINDFLQVLAQWGSCP